MRKIGKLKILFFAFFFSIFYDVTNPFYTTMLITLVGSYSEHSFNSRLNNAPLHLAIRNHSSVSGSRERRYRSNTAILQSIISHTHGRASVR